MSGRPLAVFIAALGLLASLPAVGESVAIEFCAVAATDEDRETPHFDPGLERIRQDVSQLPYDTYRKVKAGTARVAIGERESAKLNGDYTLVLAPKSRERQDGPVRLDVTVEMKPRKDGEKPVQALATTVTLTPGKRLKLRGLRMDTAELIIILSVK